MRNSKKDKYNILFNEQLDKLTGILLPTLKSNGLVDFAQFENPYDMAYAMAVLINSKFIISDEKHDRSFGADDVMPIQILIEEHHTLKYWGKINWLFLPDDHQCHRSSQDPFYGVFELKNEKLSIVQILFGDYSKTDLDASSWIHEDIDWMFEM